MLEYSKVPISFNREELHGRLEACDTSNRSVRTVLPRLEDNLALLTFSDLFNDQVSLVVVGEWATFILPVPPFF